MDTLYYKDVETPEKKGLRVYLHKEDVQITKSGQDIVFKVVDNSYDIFPKVKLSPGDALKLANELLSMINYHKSLLRDDIRGEE
ncbi:MAG: hypothetical protein H6604_02365 [Flavobacteriales bacterium]|nr:hypothetical protein [Flavobacteriales bacterium]